MNSYKHQFLINKMDKGLFSKIEERLLNYCDYEQSKTENPDNNDSSRKSKVCFLDDPEIYDILWKFIDEVNEYAFWNFEVDKIEPLQNTLYEVGDYYQLHIDESEWTPTKRECGRIRKISFTLLLNDDFEGGEFEMITDRRIVLPLEKGDIIFFHSDIPHGVLEVTSGFRKSLVGWIQGPAFK